VPLGAGGADVREAILDGEVVALDRQGRQNFRDLLTGRGNRSRPLPIVIPIRSTVAELRGGRAGAP
jgi:hypothetical protein